MEGRLSLIVALTLVLQLEVPGGPKSAAASQTAATSVASQIGSPSWHVRRQAFDAIQQAMNNPARSGGASTNQSTNSMLIELLAKEASYVASSTSFGEDYTEYFANLIGQVVLLKDPRAVDVLLNRQVLTTGMVAIAAVAAYGDSAVDRVLGRYKTASSVDERTALVVTLHQMLAKRTLIAPRNRSTVRSVLIAATADPEPMLRIAAVRGLGEVSDADSVRVLETLRASDDYSISIHGKTSYPVRREAGAALEQVDRNAHHGGQN